jgi:CubicO group peptidase (beta-lactamase class C family)
MNSKLNRRSFMKMSGVTAASLLALGKAPLALADSPELDLLWAEFDQMAEQVRSQYQVPGLAIGVVHNQELIYAKGFGVMQLGTTQPVTPQSVQRLASMSKSFTAVAVMQLYEAGMLDIDHPYCEYIPYFRLTDKRYTDITIRHLLAHTSGLPAEPDSTFVSRWLAPQYDDGAAERYVRSLYDMDIKLSGKPGNPKNFVYSGRGYHILADLVHKVSGELFEDYCRSHILAPLSMEHSGFKIWEVPPGLLQAAHTRDEYGEVIVSPVYPYTRPLAAGSGLFSDINDLGNWVRMNFNGGCLYNQAILQPSSHAMLWEPLSTFNDSWDYGWGWFLGSLMGRKLVYHPGDHLGVITAMALLPEEGLAVTMLGNLNSGIEPFYASEYVFWALARLLQEGV